jgi:glucose-1-phosphate cytidylyltransferase
MNEAKEVVILAGGLGTRLQEFTELIPKPMVSIGEYPMLVHIISIYLSQGFNRFIICGGYKVEKIKEYFYNFQVFNYDLDISHSNANSLVKNFKLSSRKDYLTSILLDNAWEISVIDTGAETTTAGRLKMAQDLISSDLFLCTYGDGVSDIDIRKTVSFHKKMGALATVTAVNPPSRFGELSVSNTGLVENFAEKPLGNSRINGGYFVFSKEIFDYLDPYLSLEDGLLTTLTSQKKLYAYLHNGYWQNMDTARDVKILNDLWKSTNAPWLKVVK